MTVGPQRIDTVVVPLDGSEFSEKALPVADRLARRLGAGVLLFSAVEKEDDAPDRKAELSSIAETFEGVKVAEPVPPAVTAGPPRRRFGPHEDVDAFLHHLVHKVLGPDADVETTAIYDPISPSIGLCTYLRDRPPWLLALGSRARGGVERLMLGDVAAATVRCSVCPVLVVPGRDQS
jgi:nucleotide-binding universal stress UspA family protein